MHGMHTPKWSQISDVIVTRLFKILWDNLWTLHTLSKGKYQTQIYSIINDIHCILFITIFQFTDWAGVAQRLCNRLPRSDPGFESRWGRASRPSQGTVNGALSLNDLVVDGTLNTTNQTNQPIHWYNKYVWSFKKTTLIFKFC